jgi:hypothetical protein
MNFPDLWAEIEADQAWREEEMRVLHNQLARLGSEAEKDQFRRALILMLYAHFEGFCRFAFELYRRSINAEHLSLRRVNIAIAAASLGDVFSALRDPNKKCSLFRNEMPDDFEIHRFARDREFVERVFEASRRPASIPDSVLRVDANLNPAVLRRVLFRLGFDHDMFAHFDAEIHRLLATRNAIAHGAFRSGVLGKDYEEVRQACLEIMTSVKNEIMAALHRRTYLRSVS